MRKCSRGVIPTNSSMRWNVRAMPSRARLCVGTRVRSLAVEGDRAAVGLEQAEQAVEERRLARAVGPDEADDLPRADLEAHLVERGDAREVLGDRLRG